MNLTLGQFSALAYAASRDRVTVRDTARNIPVDYATTRNALVTLARHGLLEASVAARPRTRSYAITEQGRAFLAAITAGAQQEGTW